MTDMTNGVQGANTNSGEVLVNRYVAYNGQQIPVEADASLDQIKAVLVEMFGSQLSNAQLIENGGIIQVLVQAGEKGSDEPQPIVNRYVAYNGQQIPVEADASLDQIKAVLVEMFGSQLSNAQLIENGGIIQVLVQAGEKGSDEPTPEPQPIVNRYVAYNGQQIPVEADASLDQIKAVLVEMFGSQLSNAQLIENGGIIQVLVQAGEKGSDEPSPEPQPIVNRYVAYNGQQIPVEADASLDQIKAVLVEMFGSQLSNAQLIENGGIIQVLVQAGEKGSQI